MSTETQKMNSSVSEKEEIIPDVKKEDEEKGTFIERTIDSTSTAEMVGNAPNIQKEHQKEENATEKNLSNSPNEISPTKSVNVEEGENVTDIQKDEQEKKSFTVKNMSSFTTENGPAENLANPPIVEVKEHVNMEVSLLITETAEMEEIALDIPKDDQEKENAAEKKMLNSPTTEKEGYTADLQKEDQEKEVASGTAMLDCLATEKPEGDKLDAQKVGHVEGHRETNLLNFSAESPDAENDEVFYKGLQSETSGGIKKNLEEILYDERAEPIFDGTEVPGMETDKRSSTGSIDHDHETSTSVWPEKAVSLSNFVRSKSVVAVSSVLRRLSGRSEDGEGKNEVINPHKGNEAQEASPKSGEKSGWNPLSLIGISRDVDVENKTNQKEVTEDLLQPIPIKGRILLYTKLGCEDCKAARRFLHMKRLNYVEINIDVYPGRKMELERMAGSSAVPRVFFNEVNIGGLTELKSLDESGKLDEKIEYVVTDGPSFEAPIPPLSGEDDVSCSGGIDELAVIVRKMKSIIVVRDRFFKLRRFTNCFLGSEAVDFLSEDQYLEREEAIEFGRKLARNLFLQHVLDENVFEDGNHLYRFLDHDPLVAQCQNIPRGIIELKPKPINDISSRLRFLSYAIFEAYTSEDGKHVDYRSIHGSEEFARYLRITEELQRVDLPDMPREEKLAFFINLYNMMSIHAILVWGHPAGALERRKLLGDFKYVIGGFTYSLSAIYNGILRANQRPPYNLIKPFGAKDKRFKVALPHPEPLIHFALVCGNRSGPALRCYSPGNIDKELMEAASHFLRSGGLILDVNAKVASVSKILKWYSVDFGKNEVEVLKHAANYLEPAESQTLLELLADTQLKVVYQSYDWELNY